MGTPVLIESGTKRVFASALDHPGWSRSAKTEATALAQLETYRGRYAAVLTAAGVPFRAGALEVVERVKGDATTDFGAPGAIADLDHRSISPAQAERLLNIHAAAWATFAMMLEAASRKQLATGPRGGGRQAEAIVTHVVEAAASYLRRIAFTPSKDPSVEAVRAETEVAVRRAVAEGLPEAGPRGGMIWPVRAFVRRATWHVLDHAWEIEDRLP